MKLERNGERTFIRLAKSKLIYRLFRQNWNIGVMHHPVTEVAGLEGMRKQKEALEGLIWMEETRGTFSADPFVMPSAVDPDELTIFFELFDWRTRRGRINCVSYNKSQRKFGKSRTSFESRFHLSYPYLLKHENSYFYIPEHSAANELSLCEFDHRGVLADKHTLIGGMGLVDSTIVFWDDRYWMFTTAAGERDNSDLLIFHAPELFGPWRPHQKNPVKTDRSNARPAGQPIIHKGKLFRPAQDCASHYGSAIIINEVNVLTESEFSEAPVGEIRPERSAPYGFGLHTISGADTVTVIDGARLESRLHPSLDRFASFF